MGPPPSPENEVWDLDRLRLPAEMVGDVSTMRRPPRHRPGDPFIEGPISYAWITSACRLPGSGLHVAMACRFLCCRFRRPNRWGLDRRVAPSRGPRHGPARGHCRRGYAWRSVISAHFCCAPKEACQATGLGRVRNGRGRRSEWRRRQAARAASAFLGVGGEIHTGILACGLGRERYDAAK